MMSCFIGLFLMFSMCNAQDIPVAQERLLEKNVEIFYTNWRGEKGFRVIIPESIYFGSTEWHPEKQWLLRAWDVEKGASRDFALKDIESWKPKS